MIRGRSEGSPEAELDSALALEPGASCRVVPSPRALTHTVIEKEFPAIVARRRSGRGRPVRLLDECLA